MTGFVDPAFKGIKVTEPNFFIWRISKLSEENYEAKRIGEEHFGNFYDEDSYIIYSSTPVKKVLGRYNKRQVSKMEIHIHFWLGARVSDDETTRTVIKAMELDEVLEGAGTLHREIQGYESSRFLSYFKKGMFIKKGEIATVLTSKSVDRKEHLYAVSERGSTLVFTEQPSVSWAFMNTSSIFVLEKTNILFIWIGKEVTFEDRHLVLQVEKIMKAINACRKVVSVFDGTENKLPQNKLIYFEESLGLAVKPDLLPNSGEKNFLFLKSECRNTMKLYRVGLGKCSTITYVKGGPLEQYELDSMDICIIDHCLNGIWIWVRKNLRNEEKSRSINVAISYLDNKQQCKVPEEKKVNVNRVVEGSEPQEFKLLFKSWNDSYSVHPDHYFVKKPGKPVNTSLSAEKLENFPFLAAETQLLDLGGGKMSVARIDKGKLIDLDPEDFGIFHSEYEYVVGYIYEGNTGRILYHWIGSRVLKETEDIRPLMEHSEFKDTCVRVRIKQFMETPHFYAIFRGKILILNSPLCISKCDKMLLDRYPILLFQLIGGDVLNTLSVEVTPGGHTLWSSSVYIIRTPYLSYVWCGASSKGDERQMGRQVANKWAKYYEVIIEGYENKHFRLFMEKNGFKVGFEQAKIVPAQVTVPPTLYKCCVSNRKLGVSEIFNFDKSDLRSSQIIILDAWDTIFVWIGEDVTEGNTTNYGQIALNYLKTDPCKRSWSLPVICITQNHEPPIFRGFFPNFTKAGNEPLWNSTEETLLDSEFAKEDEQLSNYGFWRRFGVKRSVFRQFPPCKQRLIIKLAGFPCYA